MRHASHARLVSFDRSDATFCRLGESSDLTRLPVWIDVVAGRSDQGRGSVAGRYRANSRPAFGRPGVITRPWASPFGPPSPMSPAFNADRRPH
jgi:hypothetical protein